MIKTPKGNNSAASFTTTTNKNDSKHSKWKYMITACACLVLGLTQISMEQWNEIIPITVTTSIQLKKDTTSSKNVVATQPAVQYVRSSSPPRIEIPVVSPVAVDDDTNQESSKSNSVVDDYSSSQPSSKSVVETQEMSYSSRENVVDSRVETKVVMEMEKEETIVATNDDQATPPINNDYQETPDAANYDGEETSQSQVPTDSDQETQDTATSSHLSYSSSTMDLIQQLFPECISESGIIDLKTMGAYVPVLPGTEPRYDHDSCFLMKARYNCAHPPGYGKPEAFHYELVLHLNNNNKSYTNQDEKPCRVRSLVDALGGPMGLAQRPNAITGNNTDSSSTSPTRIAFHGSSYVRQMWEAMTCGFRQDITQLMVKQPGPDVSLKAMERRNNAPIEFSEIGRPIRNTKWIQNGRCHGVYKNELASYFHESVPRIPTDTIDGCNDSIAMVRFQDSVEVYFVFRPNDFSTDALKRIYSDFFQITGDEGSSSQFNAVVWNVGLEKPENILPEGVTTKQEIGVDRWLQTLMAMQRRDLGVYFGADNPWITKPPDGHPCMPGIPDDEVNLILYSMYTGYTIN